MFNNYDLIMKKKMMKMKMKKTSLAKTMKKMRMKMTKMKMTNTTTKTNTPLIQPLISSYKTAFRRKSKERKKFQRLHLFGSLLIIINRCSKVWLKI